MDFSLSILGGKVVHDLLLAHAPEAVEVVRAAYVAHGAGVSTNPPSYFLRFDDKPEARIIALPASLGRESGVAGIKWIASYPKNVRAGFPRASAVVVLNDYETGYPFAFLEGSIISAFRTAASAVLAAEQIQGGRRQAKRLAFVGTGVISKYVHRVFLARGWEIEEVCLFDVSRPEAEKFAKQVDPRHRARVVIADDVETALRTSDVITFATVAGTPHLLDPALFAHAPTVLHLSLRDLGTDVVLSAVNVVDDVEHVMKANTSVHLTEQRVQHRDFVAGTLAQLLASELTLDRSRPVIFSPFGLGVLDLAVGKWIYEHAKKTGGGVTLDDFFFETTR